MALDYLEDDTTFMGDIQADISKIKEKLNWKPKIEFEEGLKKILKVC